MGKMGVCCIPLKKAPSRESRENKDKKTRESKGCFWKTRSGESLNSSQGKTAVVSPAPPSPSPEVVDTEAVARASAVAAEAAAEVVRLTAVARSSAKSKQEIAAIKIQTSFRGHKARRALRALKAVVRLKTLIQGQPVKHQTTTTLQCMQTMARVQAQIRERRQRMSEENQALQRHLQQKHEKELVKLRASQVGEEWDDSTQSKEQIETKLQSKQEAAVRRERALAYAFTHQQTWRTTPRAASQATIMDPNNPHWGWSWLERWMATRPWESQSAIDKELSSQPNSAKSTTSNAYSPHHFSVVNKPSTPARKQSRLSVSNPRVKTPHVSSAGRVVKRSSPRRSVCSVDDDARSTCSVQSDRCRRHSVTGSSVRDDESLASSPAAPSYMASTRSAKAKSRLSLSTTPEKEPVSRAKKQLSFPGSPSGHRRHSGPPNMETSSVTDAGLSLQGSN